MRDDAVRMLSGPNQAGWLARNTRYDLGHVDKRPDPEHCRGEVEETHEGQGGLVIAGCNAAHLLKPVEHPLDAIAVPIAFPVCLLRSFTAFA